VVETYIFNLIFIIHDFCRLGFPKIIITDQGREFTSSVIDDICKLLGAEHRTTSPYHPQCNGLTGINYLLVLLHINAIALFLHYSHCYPLFMQLMQLYCYLREIQWNIREKFAEKK